MLVGQIGQAVVVHAPAKINLFLNVLGKRADGFHELETLMVTVGLYDTLSFREVCSDEIRLRCFDAGCKLPAGRCGTAAIPEGRDNLIVQAAELLCRSAGIRRGASIELVKRIPAAAGLGGGSSDAAAALVALNRLWNAGLSQSDLCDLAAELGSDIPFFLSPTSAAVCRGRGEIIEPLDLPLSLHVVIARPKTGLSTPLVFQHCRPSDRPRDMRRLVECLRVGHLKRASRHLHNSLQSPAERLNTEVEHLKFVFSKQPVLGHIMSGSGSAWFGICASAQHASSILARLSSQRIGCVFVAQSRP